MKDDRPYLEHIHESILRIQAYTAEGPEAFIENSMVQDAVVRNFEIVGEATKRVSDASKARSHDYMGVNLRRVWNVIEHNLPALQAAVDDLLRDA